jgi:hypothetical protein
MKTFTPAALICTTELCAAESGAAAAAREMRTCAPAVRVHRAARCARWVTATAVPDVATSGPPDSSCVTVPRLTGAGGRGLVEPTIGDSRSDPPSWLAPDFAAVAGLLGVAVVTAADEFSVIPPDSDPDAARLSVLTPLDPDVVSIVMPLALAITASPVAGGSTVLAWAVAALPEATRPSTAAIHKPRERAREPFLRSFEESIVGS